MTKKGNMGKELANRFITSTKDITEQAEKAGSLASRRFFSERGSIFNDADAIAERRAAEILRDHYLEASMEEKNSLWKRAETTNRWYEMFTK